MSAVTSDSFCGSNPLRRAAASDVGGALMTMLQTQSRHTNDLALSKVNATLTQSIVAGVLVLALVAVHAVYWTDMRMRSPAIPVLAIFAAVPLHLPIAHKRNPLN